MDFRGLVKFTLVDYPGKIGCIIFSGGCNLRCPFCHNPCLVFDPASQPRVTEKEFFHFLERRRGLLEGVVFSGGEPRCTGCAEVVGRVPGGGLSGQDRHERYAAGARRGAARQLRRRCVRNDYKAPAAAYPALTGSSDREIAQKVRRSIGLALDSGAELDVRTTVHKALLDAAALETMYGELKAAGVRSWTLQQYHPVEVIDDELSAKETFSDAELVRIARRLGPEVRVRGLTGRILESA